MPLQETEINVQSHNRDPIMLVDEVSSTDYFIGVSINFGNQTKPHWKIKRIWKIGNVWHFGFPADGIQANGSQEFKWIWDNRYLYTYKP